MMKAVELPQGTLEMLILKAVSLGPLHGYGILLRIQQISNERLEILQGSFYTAIYRLERRGWIKGEWGESENNRRARFYSLSAAGRWCPNLASRHSLLRLVRGGCPTQRPPQIWFLGDCKQ
jgi:PadR family transcriptional regulator PadR